ncbi:hypothetical protein ABIB62_002455 [Mucilaginibacter sp. UYP25]|uniref:hypothetical protein n=1 Tax=unclassified Mucilaginibacter TaxID=2617802 RepID=UPI0033996BD6
MKNPPAYNGKAIAYLVLLCLFMLQGCKKDLLQPHSAVIKNNFSIDEARKYFDKNLKRSDKLTKTSSVSAHEFSPEEMIKDKQPLWDYAYSQLLSNGEAVKIPIDFGDVYVEVTNTTKAFLPLASLNYLFMYKDSLQNIHAEWVMLKPDSSWLFGNRDTYSGGISIRDWDGKSLRYYSYANGQVVANTNPIEKQRTNSSGEIQNIENNGDIIPTQPYCLLIANGECPKQAPCSATSCDMCFKYCAKAWCSWIPPDCTNCDPPTPPTGGSSGSGGTGGGGAGIPGSSSPNPAVYPPNYNPDPNYVVPNYPAPLGYSWVLPCGPVPVPSVPPLTGSVLPIPPGIDGASIYTDPQTGATFTYANVLSEFINSPEIIDQIESGDPIAGGPIIMSRVGLLISVNCIREAEVLKYQHPDWTKVQIYTTAFWNVLGGKIHFILDVAGFVPVIGDAADLINGGIYFIEGDKINCALSVAAAIPVVGWVSTAGKWVKVSVQAVPLVNAAGKVAYKAIKVGKELRLVKMAVSVFDHAALITLKTIKPADKTLSNISSYLVNKFGLRIVPTESTLKNLVDDIVQFGDATGTKTEQLADALLQRNGFVKYESKIASNNGFDGVYIKGGLTNPTEIVINEAKQIGSMGNIKLNPGNISTGLSSQMSDAWINKTVDFMIASSSLSVQGVGKTLFNNKNLIKKTVTAVDKSNHEIVILKLESY